ncbi:ornithine carbamoyltransferase [Acidocella sp.]|uniref:ornithine carbamoyltransferase n=1 Tax=Acidocella sp. TaxID=50710 RepID=UPI0026255086|nr:ornithine carbamoyltransferase [Acidocella sp.]
MTHLRGRSVLRLDDFTQAEILDLLRLGAELKAAKRGGYEAQRLKGKALALIFEKDSTRTRSGFEVAAYDQGAHVTYMGPSGSHIGHKESVKDTARVLGRMYDAIEFRGFAQADVELLARHAGVPVYNGLTDSAHPTQVLADFMTMREFCDKPLKQVSFAFMGDGQDNVALSLAMGAAKLGMRMRFGAPEALWPAAEDKARLAAAAEVSGAEILYEADPKQAVQGVDFIYTDVWVSMGEDDSLWEERIKLLRPYQVDAALMRAAGNDAVKFMHCLPAFHNTETAVGREIERRFGLSALEVTEEVFESPASIVFDEAENRMHSIKAMLVATLA